MLLAGDVGGTKTLLGLFERAQPRPMPLSVRAYATQTFSTFTDILNQFARDIHQPFIVEAAAVGVAGPVVANRSRLTNVEWDISADEITARFGTAQVQLLNDLAALANCVEVLDSDEYVLLQEGFARPDGNAAVIAAGTGLGQAYLHRVNGRLTPVPSEGGHGDFAARTDDEFELVRMLRDTYGRAEVEHVLSGPGLVNLHRFTHRGRACGNVQGASLVDAPSISQAGLTGQCQSCVEALGMFVAAYGAEAGNLALRGVALAGLYVGGGIAPKILPALQAGPFMEAFRAKPPMTDLLARIPVKVILNPESGLLGAAVYAQDLSART